VPNIRIVDPLSPQLSMDQLQCITDQELPAKAMLRIHLNISHFNYVSMTVAHHNSSR
jgi:hypothetical protein